MGSGATAYRQALGEYQALQEHLKAAGEIELEQAREIMELEQERYELIKSGRLPGGDTPINTPQQLTGAFTTTIPEKSPGTGAISLAVLAVGAYLLLRKK